MKNIQEEKKTEPDTTDLLCIILDHTKNSEDNYVATSKYVLTTHSLIIKNMIKLSLEKCDIFNYMKQYFK